MKTKLKTLAQAVIVLFIGISITACDPENSSLLGSNGNSSGNGNFGNKNGQNSGVCIDTVPMSNLDDNEISNLKFMIEEEKMAKDVYTNLFEMYSQQIFNNISKSENTHINSVASLLDRYSIINPTIGKAVGEFESTEIQELYNSLLSQSVSLTEALSVGALIEETDIEDLDEALSQTDNADIKLVYSNLRKGSENHLRSFVGNLARLGITYTPQVLSEEEYYSIISK